MDLAELIAASKPTSCEFRGATINLDVYTGGPSCLTHEQLNEYKEAFEPFQPAIKKAQELQAAIANYEETLKESPDNQEVLEQLDQSQAELSQLDTGSVEISRVVVPLMLKGWSLNGEPMTWNGDLFLPSRENISLIPDQMLTVVGNAAMAVWNPTIATDGQSTSELEAQKPPEESDQIEVITPSPTSDSQPDGSDVTH